MVTEIGWREDIKMMGYLEEIKQGYNRISDRNNAREQMLMDIGIAAGKAGEKQAYWDEEQETALLLLKGKVELSWEGGSRLIERSSVFDENPSCLHIARKVKVEIKAHSDYELIMQKTDNEAVFESRLYLPDECKAEQFGKGVWEEAALRIVRTVFDYSTAPYSKLVIGEVIHYPGRWSSYIPHHHPQPEVYFYKFDKPQGFGFSLIGEEACKIRHNSFSLIPGGLVHPQVAAPGYAMYYCWMIRHLDNNPWTDRVNDPAHAWLLDPSAKIWRPATHV